MEEGVTRREMMASVATGTLAALGGCGSIQTPGEADSQGSGVGNAAIVLLDVPGEELSDGCGKQADSRGKRYATECISFAEGENVRLRDTS